MEISCFPHNFYLNISNLRYIYTCCIRTVKRAQFHLNTVNVSEIQEQKKNWSQNQENNFQQKIQTDLLMSMTIFSFATNFLIQSFSLTNLINWLLHWYQTERIEWRERKKKCGADAETLISQVNLLIEFRWWTQLEIKSSQNCKRPRTHKAHNEPVGKQRFWCRTLQS